MINNPADQLIPAHKHKILRYSLAIIVIIACLLLLSTQTHHLLYNDFIGYWSAARLNISGSDPYNFDQLLNLQRQEGFRGNYPHIVWNPPWTFALISPFGLMNRPLGQMVWLFLHIAIVLYCAGRIWTLYGGSPKLKWLPLLIGFTFAPSFVALAMRGQIAPILLLGVVGFLAYVDHPQKSWLAGIFFFLTTIKPQVPYLFILAFLFWMLHQKRWKVLIAASLSLFFTIFITLLINPNIFSQYIGAIRSYPPVIWATPTFGAYLRYFSNNSGFWLQFIAPFIGCIWLTQYWFFHRDDWSWKERLPLIMLVSVVTAPYSWTYDQIVLLLPIMQCFAWLTQENRRSTIIISASIYLILDFLCLFLLLQIEDFWFIWFAPSMLIWYLITRKLHHQSTPLMEKVELLP